jgi:hypothetical protein
MKPFWRFFCVKEAEAILKYSDCRVQAGIAIHSDLDVYT